MKLLKDILYGLNLVSVTGNTNIGIKKIEFDSRKISNDNLFIAINGYNEDGNKFIINAIENGAKAIICESVPQKIDNGVTFVQVKDCRQSLALVSSNFYENPSSKLNLIGITGTNGKTTTATLMFQLFKLLNKKVGLISTNKIVIQDKEYKSNLTTPDPISLNKKLFQMVEIGVEYCFMEVSSHAIDQKRIFGLNYNVGVFTNLTHDHLDYHINFSKYRDAKKEFFDFLNHNSIAIVNNDDKHGNYIIQNCDSKIYSYSLKTSSNFSLKILEKDINGMKLKINDKEIWTNLIGEFNAYNILATFSLAQSLDFDIEETLNKISLLNNVEGRFERVSNNAQNQVGIIDYAHSPDSIEKVLITLNEIKRKNSLITVIGCGGDRDVKKRPIMGNIVASLSDFVVFTSDNPRSEDPDQIINQMIKGVDRKDLFKVNNIVDRKSAIEFACNINGKNDVILVAGKGHEKFQVFGDNRIEFDDKKILEKTLNKTT